MRLDDGIRDQGISKSLSPLYKTDDCGKNHGESRVTGTDQIEQKIGILRPGSNEIRMVNNQRM